MQTESNVAEISDNRESRIDVIGENLNIPLLLIGKIMSNISARVFSFALSLYVIDLTGSAAAFSIVLSAGLLPSIFINIFAGVFVDQHNKKNIMVISDISSGICIFMFFFIFILVPDNIAVFAAYAATLSIIQAFFTLSVRASIPNFVREDNVAKINSYFQAIVAASHVIGPILGAVAYTALGLGALFIINGIVFIVSGILEMFLKYREDKSGLEIKSNYIENMKDSFRYMNSYRILAFFFIFAAIINAIYNPLLFLVLPFITYNILKVTGIQISIIKASAAAGVIIAALIISISKSISKKLIKKFIVLFGIQAVLVLLWLFPKIPFFPDELKWLITIIYAVFTITYGLLNTLQNIPVVTYFQLKVPEELRGRMFGFFLSAVYITTPVGMWLYGILLEVMDWGYVIAGSGILMLIGFIIAGRNKYYREFISGKTE